VQTTSTPSKGALANICGSVNNNFIHKLPSVPCNTVSKGTHDNVLCRRRTVTTTNSVTYAYVLRRCTMESLPHEIVLLILEYCLPTDSALLTSKVFHPIDSSQYERKKEYRRRQTTITFGDLQHNKGVSFIPITNLLGEPVTYRTPMKKQIPGTNESLCKKSEKIVYQVSLNPNLKEFADFFKQMEAIDNAFLKAFKTKDF